MADYNYGGSEEENAELRKLEADLVCVAGQSVASGDVVGRFDYADRLG